jgi:hypothetical protein
MTTALIENMKNWALAFKKLHYQRPIPEYGDLFTLEEFLGMVEDGGITDYDGDGYYAGSDWVSGIAVEPDLMRKALLNNKAPFERHRNLTGSHVIDRRFTHVIWFNK